ncbi:transcriptional regulator of filamentous growth FLO8-like isoform X2 [Drosophila rhopaloa]|nr:transcriptional regulator of filamentous growth FLO8-like isoform X2 [Drosophila rhopaloa]XP_016988255.1 transcriptional regulator of filamentous growth FLO8-like isoform X2 [Drosophila rhopaloa]
MAPYPQLQKRQQVQKHHPVYLPQAYPLMNQQQLIQQQQQEQRQQQQYYFAQIHPHMGAAYDTRPWLLYPNHQQSDQNGSYQYWYGRPQPLYTQPAAPPNPNFPGIIPPSYQQANGAYSQSAPAPKHRGKAANRIRSSAHNDQAQPGFISGRPRAGGRLSSRPESSTGYTGSQKRIDSLSRFQAESGSRIRDFEEDKLKYRRIAARARCRGIEEVGRKLQKENEIQERKSKEDKLDANLGSGASSLFQRLAQFMRSRSRRKSKLTQPKSNNRDEAPQNSSVISKPKKRGLLSRFFGEVREQEVDICDQRQTKSVSVSSVHYPTNMPMSNRDLEDLREAENFRKLRERQQRKKLEDSYLTPAEK